MQIVESVTDTLGGLQDWPAEAVQADNTGAQYVSVIPVSLNSAPRTSYVVSLQDCAVV